MSTLYDGDSSDLVYSTYLYPDYSGYQTGYGHADWVGDIDFCSIYIGTSGYYDLSSTGDTDTAIWDATAGTWLYGDSYEQKVYVNSAHANYLFVRGNTAGESYSATVKPYHHHFNITFDYRYDTAGLFTSDVRADLDAAAGYWEKYIEDDFATISATSSYTVDFSSYVQGESKHTGTLGYSSDDLVIFVTAGTFSSSNSTTLAAGAATSDDGDKDVNPSFGYIMFNKNSNWFADPTPSTSADIPSNKTDLITVAAHEIGHVLGINDSISAYAYYVSGGYFTGPTAKQANGGSYVALGSSSYGGVSHLASSSDLMYYSTSRGKRVTPSAVDLGILADIGYVIDWTG